MTVDCWGTASDRHSSKVPLRGTLVIRNHQAVIGGARGAVQKAMDLFLQAGYDAVPLPVTQAFHTALVSSLCQPIRRTLERIRLNPPRVPTVSSVDGQFYATGTEALPRMIDTLERHVASPVEFVKALHALYGARRTSVRGSRTEKGTARIR